MIGEIGAIAEAEAVSDPFAVIDFDGLDGDAGDLDGRRIEDVRCEAGSAGFEMARHRRHIEKCGGW